MANVKELGWNDETNMPTEKPVAVKVGDYVCFKSDHEQSGQIVKIEGDRLTLESSSGFGGDYLRGASRTVVSAHDCWVE